MKLTVGFLGFFMPLLLWAQQVVVQDSDIQNGDQVVWTADQTYILDGLVFVEEGATLTIEPGTVIKGKAVPTTGDYTSALIITRGAKIIADGRPDAPIIFTAEADDVVDPMDLSLSDRGLWGGLIVLGYATINTATGVGQIEGIDPNESRARYGGGDLPTGPVDTDTSGVLRYVSIRHGGAEIGPGDEINGLTLGAVGSGTVIEYVEVISNLDDGFEWFGGTVNTRYLISAFNADDAFDYDQGFRGKGQFWFAIQAPDFGGRIAEQDGGTDPEDGQPYAIPVISNVTFIGPGVDPFPQGDGAQLMIFRDNAGGKYFNSIFTEYNGSGGGAGITIEDLSGTGEDSRKRLEAGDLLIQNNIWWQFGDGNDWESIAPQSFVRQHLQANGNQIVDPQLRSISRSMNGQLDPRPLSNSPASSGAIVLADSFFASVPYLGAFDPNAPLWLERWSALYQYNVTKIAETENSGQTWIATAQLFQNYPNPFNPVTTITYTLQKAAPVRLTIVNGMGQIVSVLVNRYQTAGTYSVQWNGVRWPSGVYYYQLQAGTNQQVRRMLLLK